MSHPRTMRRAAVVAASAMTAVALTVPAAQAAHRPEPTLRSEAPGDLKIGSAVFGERDLLGYDPENPTEFQRILASEFNSLTAENDMKWSLIHPEPGVYDFEGADAVVKFAQANGQEVRGHTLFWHSQNSQWVIDASETWTCEQARDVLEDHVRTVVGRYAGEIYEWDVANEIFQDTWDVGGVRLRTEANPFLKACAEDPVALIGDLFRWAHEADPEALLFLNDYNLEGINEKTDAYYALAQELLADGVPLHGFGAQGHLSLQYGFDESMQENFERFADLGLKVAVTEADVRMPLGEDGEPDAEQIALQAERFDKMLEACLNVPACTSFTVWGFDDERSWVPGVFPEGYATIMTAEFERKPAYFALRQSLTDAQPNLSLAYVYKKVNPNGGAGWGNSALQRLVVVQEGHQRIRLTADMLPADVCGPGWAVQEDWTVNLKGDPPPVLDRTRGISIGWDKGLRRAWHHSLEYHLDVPACDDEAGGRSLTTQLTGEVEVPNPGDPDGEGVAELRVNPGQGEICYTLEVTGIEPATAAHIHEAPAGQAGGVVVPLEAPADGSSSSCVEVERDLALDIIGNPANYYVNVHNPSFPGGALRGQLG